MPDLPDTLKLRGLIINEWTYEVETGWYEDCDTVEAILEADLSAFQEQPWAFMPDEVDLDHTSVRLVEDRGPIIIWPDGRIEFKPVGWTG